MEVLSSQVTAAAVVSFLIAFLKKQAWFPLLTSETEKLNRLAAVVLSGLAALGISVSFNHEAGQLIVSGLTASTIVTGLWHWLQQFALTHGWFKATSASDEIYALLKKLAAAKLEQSAAAPAVSAAVTGKV